MKKRETDLLTLKQIRALSKCKKYASIAMSYRFHEAPLSADMLLMEGLFHPEMCQTHLGITVGNANGEPFPLFRHMLAIYEGGKVVEQHL